MLAVLLSVLMRVLQKVPDIQKQSQGLFVLTDYEFNLVVQTLLSNF